MQTFAHLVGEPAHSEQVGGTVERDSVLETKPGAGGDFIADRFETGIFELRRHLNA